MDPVRIQRALSFNDDPEGYDRSRPTYPPAVYDALWKLAELPHHPSVVEVGCGTGQASRELLRRGSKLTCVEMGDRMAALARKNLEGLGDFQIVVSKFEEWEPSEAPYDLVFAAASWHWIELEVKYKKAASLLKTNGHLAIVGSKHVYPEGYDPRYNAIQEAYRSETGSSIEWPPKPPDAVPIDLEEPRHGGYFADVQVVKVLWHLELSAQEYVNLLSTYSDHRIMNPDQRARLFEKVLRAIGSEGTIRKHYQTTLRVATKSAD